MKSANSAKQIPVDKTAPDRDSADRKAKARDLISADRKGMARDRNSVGPKATARDRNFADPKVNGLVLTPDPTVNARVLKPAVPKVSVAKENAEKWNAARKSNAEKPENAWKKHATKPRKRSAKTTRTKEVRKSAQRSIALPKRCWYSLFSIRIRIVSSIRRNGPPARRFARSLKSRASNFPLPWITTLFSTAIPHTALFPN
jgi:hypothetical protein